MSPSAGKNTIPGKGPRMQERRSRQQRGVDHSGRFVQSQAMSEGSAIMLLAVATEEGKQQGRQLIEAFYPAFHSNQ